MVAGDDRNAARLRLEDRDAEALAHRGVEQHVERLVQVGDEVLVHDPEVPGVLGREGEPVLGDADRARQRHQVDAAALGLRLRVDVQVGVLVRLGELRERVERLRKALARELRRALVGRHHPDDEGVARDLECLARLVPKLGLRLEDLRVDAVRDVQRVELELAHPLLAVPAHGDGLHLLVLQHREHRRRDRVVVERRPDRHLQIVGPLVGLQHPGVAERDDVVGLEVLGEGGDGRVAPVDAGREDGDAVPGGRLRLQPEVRGDGDLVPERLQARHEQGRLLAVARRSPGRVRQPEDATHGSTLTNQVQPSSSEPGGPNIP